MLPLKGMGEWVLDRIVKRSVATHKRRKSVADATAKVATSLWSNSPQFIKDSITNSVQSANTVGDNILHLGNDFQDWFGGVFSEDLNEETKNGAYILGIGDPGDSYRFSGDMGFYTESASGGANVTIIISDSHISSINSNDERRYVSGAPRYISFVELNIKGSYDSSITYDFRVVVEDEDGNLREERFYPYSTSPDYTADQMITWFNMHGLDPEIGYTSDLELDVWSDNVGQHRVIVTEEDFEDGIEVPDGTNFSGIFDGSPINYDWASGGYKYDDGTSWDGDAGLVDWDDPSNSIQYDRDGDAHVVPTVPETNIPVDSWTPPEDLVVSIEDVILLESSNGKIGISVGDESSPLKITTSIGVNSGVYLVDVDDEDASPVRISTQNGIKALKLFTGTLPS